jgi:hypothetical protein
LLAARLSTCGDSFRFTRATRLICVARARVAGDIDRRLRMLNAARRYWQLADSDDAVTPRCALSTAAVREVTERSDEHIEGQTFDVYDGP